MQINTTAPISIDNLRKYFVDKSITFNIDYDASTLKGSKLLVYLSNLDVPANIQIDIAHPEYYNLIKEYLESSFVLNIESLEKAVIEILCSSRGLNAETKHQQFIEQNDSLIQDWSSKLDSLTLYNLYTINDNTFKDYVKEFPEGESSTKGINFVSLLKHQDFFAFYQALEPTGLKYYKEYFNDYIFKGKNLFSFWATENNPLFLLTFGISEGLIQQNKDTKILEVVSNGEEQ